MGEGREGLELTAPFFRSASTLASLFDPPFLLPTFSSSVAPRQQEIQPSSLSKKPKPVPALDPVAGVAVCVGWFLLRSR